MLIYLQHLCRQPACLLSGRLWSLDIPPLRFKVPVLSGHIDPTAEGTVSDLFSGPIALPPTANHPWILAQGDVSSRNKSTGPETFYSTYPLSLSFIYCKILSHRAVYNLPMQHQLLVYFMTLRKHSIAVF